MKIEEVYNKISSNINVKFLDIDLAGSKSSALKVNAKYALFIDSSAISTQSEEKMLLMHELGHIETESFYNSNNVLDLLSKHEYRANAWAIKNLVPKDELLEAIHQGNTEPWQLAEYFDLPQDFMEKAVCYYRSKEY